MPMAIVRPLTRIHIRPLNLSLQLQLNLTRSRYSSTSSALSLPLPLSLSLPSLSLASFGLSPSLGRVAGSTQSRHQNQHQHECQQQNHSSSNSSFSFPRFSSVLLILFSSVAGYSLSSAIAANEVAITQLFRRSKSVDGTPNPQSPKYSRSAATLPFDWAENQVSSLSPAVKIILGLHVSLYLLYILTPLKSMMVKHFMCSVDGLVTHRRYHTLLTSVFTHATPLHMIFNSLCLASMAGPLAQLMSTNEFLSFYCISGIGSSITNNIYIASVSKANRNPSIRAIPQLGASGAVYAIVALAACVTPDLKLGIMFLPFEFTAMPFVQCIAAIEVVMMLRSRYKGTTGIGHGAHLGGLVCGFVAYEYYKRFSHRIKTYVDWRNKVTGKTRTIMPGR